MDSHEIPLTLISLPQYISEVDYIPAVKWRLLDLSADGEILMKLIKTVPHRRSCALGFA
jgi:hypothetical protein